jgi:hypothetical protein
MKMIFDKRLTVFFRLRRVNLSYGFKNHIPVDKSKFGLENVS